MEKYSLLVTQNDGEKANVVKWFIKSLKSRTNLSYASRTMYSWSFALTYKFVIYNDSRIGIQPRYAVNPCNPIVLRSTYSTTIHTFLGFWLK